MSDDVSVKEINTSQQDEARPNNNLLYIDDNLINLNVVAKWLSKTTQYNLLTATNAQEGLTLVKENNPALILLDLNLPGMNGYEFLDYIRNESAFSKTPVIAVTARAMLEDIERGLAAGFDDYITKPIELSALTSAIQKLLPNRH